MTATVRFADGRERNYPTATAAGAKEGLVINRHNSEELAVLDGAQASLVVINDIHGATTQVVTAFAQRTSARRVLVIDDDEAGRLTLARVLRLEGYSVQVAATAAEALGSVQHERPDAIFLDLNMPFVNGVGFLYRLRQVPANQDIAVAVITGALALDDATVTDLRTLHAQVWDKPLSLEEIQQVARILLP